MCAEEPISQVTTGHNRGDASVESGINSNQVFRKSEASLRVLRRERKLQDSLV